jgi:hypothetical protein
MRCAATVIDSCFNKEVEGKGKGKTIPLEALWAAGY